METPQFSVYFAIQPKGDSTFSVSIYDSQASLPPAKLSQKLQAGELPKGVEDSKNVIHTLKFKKVPKPIYKHLQDSSGGKNEAQADIVITTPQSKGLGGELDHSAPIRLHGAPSIPRDPCGQIDFYLGTELSLKKGAQSANRFHFEYRRPAGSKSADEAYQVDDLAVIARGYLLAKTMALRMELRNALIDLNVPTGRHAPGTASPLRKALDDLPQVLEEIEKLESKE